MTFHIKLVMQNKWSQRIWRSYTILKVFLAAKSFWSFIKSKRNHLLLLLKLLILGFTKKLSKVPKGNYDELKLEACLQPPRNLIQKLLPLCLHCGHLILVLKKSLIDQEGVSVKNDVVKNFAKLSRKPVPEPLIYKVPLVSGYLVRVFNCGF